MMYSIVITTFNRLKLLLEAIQSVESQKSICNYEIIIQDDGSTDGTKEYFSNISKNHILYEWTENVGRVAAQRKGFTRANGTYIFFLDSDDLWLPGKFLNYTEIIEKMDIDFLYSCASYVDGTRGSSLLNIDKNKLHSVQMPMSSIAVKKSFLLKYDIDDKFYTKYRRFGFEHCHHGDLVFKLYKFGNGYFFNTPYIKYRNMEDSISSNNKVFVGYSSTVTILRLVYRGFMPLQYFYLFKIFFQDLFSVFKIFLKKTFDIFGVKK